MAYSGSPCGLLTDHRDVRTINIDRRNASDVGRDASALLNVRRRSLQVDSQVGGCGKRTEQMAADGDEVNGGADEHKAVPDSVRERHDAVTFEEHNTDHVDDATGR